MKRLQNLMCKVWQMVKEVCMYQSVPVADREKQAYAGNSLISRLEAFLRENYDFRYNLLTECTEYREKENNSLSFDMVNQRVLNSLCIGARKQGMDCWDRDVSRYLCSDNIADFHPFRSYMDSLPQWDGADRVQALAERVSSDELWTKGFHRWMLALAAQWMELDGMHGNSVAPVLVSRRQGRQKSTFCKLILPRELQAYYTDSFDLGSSSAAEQKLSTFGLISLDEMDKYSPKKMAVLKNLMQMAGLNIRKAYKKNFASLPRMASFIATSNVKELLTDPTGSRRFLCVEVNEKIDCSPLDYFQLYAQLKAELLSGKRYWFTGEEEKEIMEHNLSFYKTPVEEDVFHSCFRVPGEGEAGVLLSAAEIFRYLKKYNSTALQGVTAKGFSYTLGKLDVEKIHQSTGNVYRVVFLHLNEGKASIYRSSFKYFNKILDVNDE